MARDEDRSRVCVACKEQWIFEEKEEIFLREIFGTAYKEPQRCIPCRRRAREKKRASPP